MATIPAEWRVRYESAASIFVPMLLFTAVKNVVLFGYRVYNKLLASSIFRLGTSTSETVQHLAAQQETNSFPLR